MLQNLLGSNLPCPSPSRGEAKSIWGLNTPGCNCSFCKMLGTNNLPIAEAPFGVGINFTFSSVFWKRPIWFFIVGCEAWMVRVNPRVHKPYYNALSSFVKATSCWPYSSWKPQKLWGVCREFPHFPISLHWLDTRGSPKNFSLLIY